MREGLRVAQDDRLLVPADDASAVVRPEATEGVPPEEAPLPATEESASCEQPGGPPIRLFTVSVDNDAKRGPAAGVGQ